MEITNIKPRIAIFTPLPPMKSGISYYSYYLIDALSKYFDIDIYVDKTFETFLSFENLNINISEYTSFLNNKRKYVNVIYHIGNSHFHSYMYDILKHHPGIVYLHETNLNGLAYDIAINKVDDYLLMKNFLVAQNLKFLFYSKKKIQSYVNTNYKNTELNKFILKYSTSIIVHTNYAKEHLMNMGVLKTIDVVPFYSSKILPNKEFDQKNVNAKHKLILGSFGFINEPKRIIPIIKSLSILKKLSINFHYFLVGEGTTEYINQVKDCINNLDLQENITITGYKHMEDFEAYLNACDLVINLRYPYNGESSLSLMKSLEAGKATIVTDIGSFSDLPNEICIKLPVPIDEEAEIINIQQSILKTIQNENFRTLLGSNARKYIENERQLDKISFILSEFYIGKR